MDENRRYIRIERPVVIKYKATEEFRFEDNSVGKNISEGGARFIVYENFSKGTKLDIQLEVPFDPTPISTKGETVWINRIGVEDSGIFEVGVVFKGTAQNDQKRLKKYIENEIKERNKT